MSWGPPVFCMRWRTPWGSAGSLGTRCGLGEPDPEGEEGGCSDAQALVTLTGARVGGCEEPGLGLDPMPERPDGASWTSTRGAALPMFGADIARSAAGSRTSSVCFVPVPAWLWLTALGPADAGGDIDRSGKGAVTRLAASKR